jgi:hypothetical protein
MVPVVTCPKAMQEEEKRTRRVMTIPDSLLNMMNASQKVRTAPISIFFLRALHSTETVKQR